MTDRLEPLHRISASVADELGMSRGEIAAATPAPGISARLQLLAFERNAYRDRCHALERMVAFLAGREPEPAAVDLSAQVEAQRNAALAILEHAAQVLPAVSHN